MGVGGREAPANPQDPLYVERIEGKTMAKPKAVEELTFEQAFAELEQTIVKLEEGGLTLEESLALYARGQELAAYCGQQLDQAELELKRLTPEGEEIPLETD